MSQETKTMSFKDLDFIVKKNENDYFLSIQKADIFINITRFCSKALNKFSNVSWLEFNELPIGGMMTGEMSCDFHYETEGLIKRIDGKDGSETLVVGKTDKDLYQLIIKIFNDADEIYSDEIADHLTDSEKVIIQDYIVSEYERSIYSGVRIK